MMKELVPDQPCPPRVLIAMVFHGAMLVGLLRMMKWASLGAGITLLFTGAFFMTIGSNRFPVLALLNLAPVFFLGIASLASRR